MITTHRLKDKILVPKRPLLLVGISFFLVASAILASGANAQPEGVDPVIKHLSEARSISIEEATKRIKWQDKASDLFDDLEKTIPKQHGGVWIGKDDDRVKVGVVKDTPSATKTKISGKVAQFALQGNVDYVPVEHSFEELKNAAKSLTDQPDSFDKANNEWQIQIGIIPSKNKVMLSLPPKYIELTDRQQNFLAKAKKQYGSMIGTVYYPGKPQNQDECSPRYCERPLRGGVRINANFYCTAGFIVRGKYSGNPYVLTAGHCSESNGVGTTGETWTSKKAWVEINRTIGPVQRNEYRQNGVDAMIIKRRTDLSWVWSAKNWVYLRDGTAIVPYAPPNRNTRYVINGHRANAGLEGERVCFSGAETGSSCGPVVEVGGSITLDGVRTFGVVRAGYCSQDGDSGGPIFRLGKALGIHKGIAAGGTCSNWKYYTGVGAAFTAMDNNIVDY